MDVEIRGLVIENRRGKTPEGKLTGVGPLVDQRLLAEEADYRFFEGDDIPLPQGLEMKPRLLWDRLEVPSGYIDGLAKSLIDKPWKRFAEQAEKEGGWKA